MAEQVGYCLHEELASVPEKVTVYVSRRSAAEALRRGEGPYVTAICGQIRSVPKKANGKDFEEMLGDMADSIMKRSSDAYRQRLNGSPGSTAKAVKKSSPSAFNSSRRRGA
jgi:hypothetical protein